MKITILLTTTALLVASAGFAQTVPKTAASSQPATTSTAPSSIDVKAQKAAAAAQRKKMAELKRQYGAGPYPEEIDAYLSGKPATLQPLYRTLFTGGERNAVLNFERLGLAAMDQGYWKDAETAFDGALLRIEAIYANNKQAEAARSLFHNEANKEFKGEPYERAMAYYYRGLLYLRAGDYDNARASFKSAEYQDTVSEVEQFKSDFAVMNYLTGWTYHCQGSDTSAEEAFAAARATDPALRSPAPGETMLVIAELGRAPVKARDGTQAEKLVFNASTDTTITGASFDLGGGPPVATLPASSLYVQATTRGGRPIDGILAGKANFKETTAAIGDVAMMTSMTRMASGDTSGGMMGMAAVGALFSMFSAAAKTLADIRGWDTLPDTITLGTAPLPRATLAAKVTYFNGPAPSGQPAAPAMIASAGKCGVAWSRSHSSADISPDVPGEDLGVAKAVARKAPVQLKDKAFRSALADASMGQGS